MKKPLLLIVLALSLSSCDLFNGFGPVKKNSSNSQQQGISLRLQCNDGLQIAQKNNDVFNDCIELIDLAVGTTTIKRYEGGITFYKPPVYGHAQLEEINNNDDNSMYFFEYQVKFSHTSGKNLYFVYFTGISWTPDDDHGLLNQNLRLAVFDKDTNSDYFVFSEYPEGVTSETEYPLDLDMDGENDRNQDGDIKYTTGFPYYATDSYSIAVPMQRDIDNDSFDPFHTRMRVDNGKVLTIRLWVEGWLVDNLHLPTGTANIQLDFAPHFAK